MTLKKYLFGILLLCFFAMPLAINTPSNNSLISMTTVNASPLMDNLTNVSTTAGLSTPEKPNLITIIGNIIKIILGFLGIFAIIMIIIGGIMWMTSGGAEEKTKKARDMIVHSMIGLIIILTAYVITYWVINQLETNVLTKTAAVDVLKEKVPLKEEEEK